MNFNQIVGQTFQEQAFYESLLFEIEANLEKYAFQYIQFYFDRLNGGLICITEVEWHQDTYIMREKSKKNIEKREWFQIYGHPGHMYQFLCRLDRTGLVSVIKKNHTHTQPWKMGFFEFTSIEIKQGFQELAGLLQEQSQLQRLRPKKAI